MTKRKRLIARRKELSKTQERLASDAGVTKRSIVRWEQGAEIRMDMRQGYANALEWPLTTFNAALAEDDGLTVVNGYHSVTHDLGLLVGLEQGASELRTWQPVVVHSLLQTGDYARAVERLWPPGVTDDDQVGRRVAFRLERQRVLTRQPFPLRLWALLDASVFLRTTGDPAVMAAQLAHLRAVDQLPNVDIRVAPLNEQLHVAARGSFVLLTAPGGAVPYVVVTENVSDVTYQGNAADVKAHLEVWDHVWEQGYGLDEVELQRT